jgi:4-amino-4-deoxy-L-arabinose transferase-like glycosyltransferase
VIRNALRILALGLGAAHTTVAVLKQSINEDGIGYLDLGDALMRGDWDMAVNGIWSPLYAAFLGLVLKLFDPGIRWEFPAAQITNFIIYALALICFEYFWRQLTARYRQQVNLQPDSVGFDSTAFMVLGYSLFIWSSLNLTEIWAVTPDMLVAALVYLAAGLLIRLSSTPTSTSTALLLGVTLGVGYLAKASMMPLGLVCLVLTLAIAGNARVRLQRLAFSTSGFLIVALPLLVAVSLEHGKPTFSDVGRFTYLKHVNEMPYPNFQSKLVELKGSPLHPPRRIHESPPVYEFAQPVGGTYPMAFDPGYWTSGLQPTVALPQQLRAVATNLMVYFDIFVRSNGGFLAIVALLTLLSFPRSTRSRSINLELVMIMWALAALGMYSLVYVTGRYIAPFTVLFWSALLSLIALPNQQHFRRLLHFGAPLLVVFVWINIGALNLEGLAGMTGFTPLSESGEQQNQFSTGHETDHPAVAEGVLAQGLERGDEIGFIGYSFSAYWARLGGSSARVCHSGRHCGCGRTAAIKSNTTRLGDGWADRISAAQIPLRARRCLLRNYCAVAAGT